MTNNAPPAQAAKPAAPSRPVNQAAPVPAPPAITQPSQPARISGSPAREVHKQPERIASQSAEETAADLTGRVAGIELPTDLAGDGSGNLLLPQFIQYIRDNLGLTPKEAMKLLNVKSLSGINLRDALEQLLYRVGQPEGMDAHKVNNRTRDNESEAGHNEPNIRNMREIRPTYVFEEEDDPDEEIRNDFDENELDEFGLSEELTAQQRAR